MLRYFQAMWCSSSPKLTRKNRTVKMTTLGLRTIVMSAVLAAAVALAASPQAQTSTSQRLVVVVNDYPITDYDVDQRMRLNEMMGHASGSEAQQRKTALEALIDDVIKRAEAKRLNLEPTEQQIAEAIERMAKSTGSTVEGLTSMLRPKGVSMNTLKQYVSASLAFNGIATRQYNVQVNVDESEIDRRLASMKSDPRFKPVPVFELQEIALPVEQTAESMIDQLFQARVIEAQQLVQRFTSCDKTRAAASGIFNVKISEVIQVPVEQLPNDMKKALEEAGPGKLLGPMRISDGIQFIAFCRRTTVETTPPTRDMVESLLLNEKYQLASQRILRDLRRSAYIDYKESSRTQ
jgi:peptidyl-prolyl cis-trans isomerase SurA